MTQTATLTAPSPTAPSPTANYPPPDWYDDPMTPNVLRYWDGSHWTEQLAPRPAPQVATSPVIGVVGRKSSKAKASMVMGIVGLLVFPIVFSVLAIIYAVSARGEIDKDPGIQNGSQATAGLWMGIVGLAFWALILVAAGA
jgi:hypothetical protein